MDRRRRVRLSKRLALHLRHDPAAIGIELDAQGWVRVDALLHALRDHGMQVTRAELDEVAHGGDTQRFEISADGRAIRARYGHSVAVDPAHPVREPPPVLFHGTSERSLPAVLRDGLRPMERRSVHLSQDIATARQVGARHGRPVVLRVDAAGMLEDGVVFTLAGGTWLVDVVAPRWLEVVDEER